MRDINHNVKVTGHLDAVVLSASKTDNAGVDKAGYESLMFICSVGLNADAGNLSGSIRWDLKLMESDDNTTFTAVADADIVLDGTPSGGIFYSINAAAKDNIAVPVGYIGNKRYVRVDAVKVSTAGNQPLSIVAVQGSANVLPTF